MTNILLSHVAFNLPNYQNFSELISELNSVIVIARHNDDHIFGNRLVSEIDTGLGFFLYELAYEDLTRIRKFIPNFTNDTQKVLLKLLSIGETPLSSHTIEDLEIEFEEEHNGLIGMAFNPSINFDKEIIDEKTWYHFHRQYFVSNCPSRQEFVTSVSPYFPNLHFSDTIATGLANFNGVTYTEIIKTIIYHLAALNDDYIELFEKNRNIGADSVCDILEERYSAFDVSIGASRDTNGLKELQFFFTNNEGQRRTFDCNLHTKFESYFEINTPNHNQRSNRIYFHQPIADFENGKVLVGRIGKHRETGFH